LSAQRLDDCVALQAQGAGVFERPIGAVRRVGERLVLVQIRVRLHQQRLGRQHGMGLRSNFGLASY
jgi:hypothetical protein